MGWRRSKVVSFGAVAVGSALLAACGTPPPPPPKTPANLVSNAEFASITRGITVEEVERRLGKRLQVESDSINIIGGEAWIFRSYGYTGELGPCYQSISVRVSNVTSTFDSIGPLVVSDVSKYEFGCDGIVK
jgi:hypothetical protein